MNAASTQYLEAINGGEAWSVRCGVRVVLVVFLCECCCGPGHTVLLACSERRADDTVFPSSNGCLCTFISRSSGDFDPKKVFTTTPPIALFIEVACGP